MPVANLVIFVIAVAGLALLVWQNLTPSVSLVFLGTQSPAFPLSFWIVLAIAVGVILSLFIWSLFLLSDSESVAVSQSSSPPRSPKPPVQPTGFAPEVTPSPSPSYSSVGQTPHSPTTSTAYASPQPSRSTASTNDDWETEIRPIPQSWDDEDWGLDEEEPIYSTPSEPAVNEGNQSSEFNEPVVSQGSEVRSSNASPPDDSPRDQYEVEQKPKRESWSGSVYSYGYREGGDTGVGKSESVYDADYRVITPPPAKTEIQDDEEAE